MTDLARRIAKIGTCFAIEGRFVDGREIESGYINTTYLASYQDEKGEVSRYILQRINEHVFTDPQAVMQNIERVTEHIREKIYREDPQFSGQVLKLYPGHDGASCVTGPAGGIWRCYNFIEGCRTYDVVENTRQAYEAAKAFGAFQELVSDLPAEHLAVTIPDFHDTPARYRRLREVLEKDSHARAAAAKEELEFIEERADLMGLLLAHLKAGRLKERVTHNDTKLNNVMIDQETDQAVCVIDLDTVMPGLGLYDFGDLVRCATSPVGEDERELSLVEMRMSMFEAIVQGYLEATHDFLSPLEIELLPFSAKLITLETAMRFLTDYLEGDVYFKTQREGHNLDRCRAQLALVKSIEEQEEEMLAFVKNWHPA